MPTGFLRRFLALFFLRRLSLHDYVLPGAPRVLLELTNRRPATSKWHDSKWTLDIAESPVEVRDSHNSFLGSTNE
ncbi:hypothetical protein M758_6G103900 [Ceratodon purpureus]|uniref:Secreted protein n=1 Tax=Ceratodon purpureus TaxID=3225 RepID=A0A8T0HFE1_CERPU|nr:hypothetical protein KC19_6G107700 [Ceratodon purpureus]KAG0613454.1 hypothetical protein M758_6G103900 [Ceratodon purpureus]